MPWRSPLSPPMNETANSAELGKKQFIMTNQKILDRNLEVIRRYMTMKGQERAERWKMFTDDATTGLQYTADGKGMTISGIDNIRQGDQFNCKNFPDWGFSNLEYFYSVDDPNHILVECDGEGTSMLLGRPIHHKDHYIHKFHLRDGKICLYREFMNPCNELLEMGLTLPEPPVSSDDMTK